MNIYLDNVPYRICVFAARQVFTNSLKAKVIWDFAGKGYDAQKPDQQLFNLTVYDIDTSEKYYTLSHLLKTKQRKVLEANHSWSEHIKGK